MKIKEEIQITAEYLRENPNHIFVFGDNVGRKGYGGAAALRDEANTYGFITMKNIFEDNTDYTPEEYIPMFLDEAQKLRNHIQDNPGKTFLISKVGAGIANRNHIWEEIIQPALPAFLMDLENVILLWK